MQKTFSFNKKLFITLYICINLIIFSFLLLFSLITNLNNFYNLNGFNFFFSSSFLQIFYFFKNCNFIIIYLILLSLFSIIIFINNVLYYNHFKLMFKGLFEIYKIHSKNIESIEKIELELKTLKEYKLTFIYFLLNFFSFFYSIFFFKTFFGLFLSEEFNNSHNLNLNYHFLWFNINEKDPLYILPLIIIFLFFIIPIIKIIIKKIKNKNTKIFNNKKEIILKALFFILKISATISCFFNSVLPLYIIITYIIRIVYNLVKTILINGKLKNNEEINKEEIKIENHKEYINEN